MDFIERMLNIAAKEAIKRNAIDKRCFRLGSVGIRSDGAIVYSRNTSNYIKNRKIHAEYRLSKKLDYYGIVFVARVLRDGSLGMARPCPDCVRALKSRRVRKVYYSIANNEYGCINLEK